MHSPCEPPWLPDARAICPCSSWLEGGGPASFCPHVCGCLGPAACARLQRHLRPLPSVLSLAWAETRVRPTWHRCWNSHWVQKHVCKITCFQVHESTHHVLLSKNFMFEILLSSSCVGFESEAAFATIWCVSRCLLEPCLAGAGRSGEVNNRLHVAGPVVLSLPPSRWAAVTLLGV